MKLTDLYKQNVSKCKKTKTNRAQTSHFNFKMEKRKPHKYKAYSCFKIQNNVEHGDQNM